MSDLIIARTTVTAREALAVAQQAGHRVGLVLTMGALHEGHLSLIDRARASCTWIAVTIFVNPTQFGPQDDLHQYPRSWEADLRALRHRHTDLVFAPATEVLYSPHHSTVVQPPDVGSSLEGEFRPGHFSGVTTVVLKLFHILAADVAFFGQKDYQQCLVIRDMVRDLDVPIQLEFCPTVRDDDGLALSSRNKYLGADERCRALSLSEGLQTAQRRVVAGERDTSAIEAEVIHHLETAGINSIDYVTVRDAETLASLDTLNCPAVLLLAARVGTARLIDNVLLQPPVKQKTQIESRSRLRR